MSEESVLHNLIKPWLKCGCPSCYDAYLQDDPQILRKCVNYPKGLKPPPMLLPFFSFSGDTADLESNLQFIMDACKCSKQQAHWAFFRMEQHMGATISLLDNS